MWNVISLISLLVSLIVNVILFIRTIYLHSDNRKLRGFEIEKNIKLKELEIKELEEWYKKEGKKLLEILQSEHKLTSGSRKKRENELKQKYENKKTKLNAELKYLKKAEKI